MGPFYPLLRAGSPKSRRLSGVLFEGSKGSYEERLIKKVFSVPLWLIINKKGEEFGKETE